MKNFTLFKIPLFLLSFTPLVYFSGVLFPFIFSKVFFIRFLIFIFCFFSLLLLFFPKEIQKLINRAKIYFKNPIFISLLVFIFLMGIGVIFAPSSFKAFWGDLERGEGFSSWVFYFIFLIALVLLFSKRDWTIFFILNLFSFIILFSDQIYFFINKKNTLWGFLFLIEMGTKNASFTGNTTFLSAYYLFAIFSVLMILVLEKKLISKLNSFLKVLIYFVSFLLIIFAVSGIFISHTMGAILGLSLGIFSVLIYLIFKKDVPKNLKIISFIIIFLGILFLIFFLLTFHSSFWKKIPGVDEIVSLKWESTPIQTRLNNYRIIKKAVNPLWVGVLRSLFGWGQEHFLYVFQKFYEPRFLQSDTSWYDRAHNKLLDVLVCQGILGLLVYLSVWFFAIRSILKDKNFRRGAALLFFAVSYFCQNLFAFDTVVTYIPFFAFLALCIQNKNKEEITEEKLEKKEFLILSKIIIILFFLFSFIVFYFTFISFYQMSNFVSLIKDEDINNISQRLDNITKPYTFAQIDIRSNLLSQLIKLKKSQNTVSIDPLIKKLTLLLEESTKKENWNAKYYALIATSYDNLNDILSAEKYWEKAVERSPSRQEFLYSLGVNYYKQNKKEKSLEIAQRLINSDNKITQNKIFYAILVSLNEKEKAFDNVMNVLISVFDEPKKVNFLGDELNAARNIFNFYLTLYYNQKNSDMFLKTLENQKIFEEKYEKTFNLNPSNSLRIQEMIDAFSKYGWSVIQLEQ